MLWSDDSGEQPKHHKGKPVAANWAALVPPLLGAALCCACSVIVYLLMRGG